MLATGCDIVNDDASIKDIKEIPNPTTQYKKVNAFALAEKPSVTNLSALYNGEEVTVIGMPESRYGAVSIISSLDNKKFLIYTPNESFVGQKDTITMKVSGKEIDLQLTIESLDDSNPCKGPVGVYDYREMHSGDTLFIDLLDNDIFCGLNFTGGLISGHDIENSENVMLSIGGSEYKATLKYIAPKNFTGKVRLIYDLGINWIVSDSGQIPIDVVLANPHKYLEAFTTALIEIEVTN